jgi:hypothetical protein
MADTTRTTTGTTTNKQSTVRVQGKEYASCDVFWEQLDERETAKKVTASLATPALRARAANLGVLTQAAYQLHEEEAAFDGNAIERVNKALLDERVQALIGGDWKVARNASGQPLVDRATDSRAVLLVNEKTKEAVLVFRGTVDTEDSDQWLEDEAAVELGDAVVYPAVQWAKEQGYALTFAGHSLGGRRAALWGTLLDVQHTTFNRAPTTLPLNYELGQHFAVRGEILGYTRGADSQSTLEIGDLPTVTLPALAIRFGGLPGLGIAIAFKGLEAFANHRMSAVLTNLTEGAWDGAYASETAAAAERRTSEPRVDAVDTAAAATEAMSARLQAVVDEASVARGGMPAQEFVSEWAPKTREAHSQLEEMRAALAQQDGDRVTVVPIVGAATATAAATVVGWEMNARDAGELLEKMAGLLDEIDEVVKGAQKEVKQQEEVENQQKVQEEAREARLDAEWWKEEHEQQQRRQEEKLHAEEEKKLGEEIERKKQTLKVEELKEQLELEAKAKEEEINQLESTIEENEEAKLKLAGLIETARRDMQQEEAGEKKESTEAQQQKQLAEMLIQMLTALIAQLAAAKAVSPYSAAIVAALKAAKCYLESRHNAAKAKQAQHQRTAQQHHGNAVAHREKNASLQEQWKGVDTRLCSLRAQVSSLNTQRNMLLRAQLQPAHK